MRVVASEDVRSFVEGNGGVLYVKARRRQCCSGAMTVLDATTNEPSDPANYRLVDSGSFPVRYRTGVAGEPDELVLEMRGLRNKRPVAYWNGCAFKI